MKTIAALSLLFLFQFTAVKALAAPPKTVVFDQGHGQKFQVDKTGKLDLSGLGGLFKKQNWKVRATREPLTDEILRDADALVISGPFQSTTTAETDAILRFVRGGGSLCVMLHVGPPAKDLLHVFNVTVSNGVIREKEQIIKGEALNFGVKGLGNHPLTRGVPRFNIYGGWALLNEGKVESVAQTSQNAWVDLNFNKKFDEGDAMQSFAVAVAGIEGKGRVVVFGDDALFQNQFLTKNNTTLAKNLIAWLGAE